MTRLVMIEGISLVVDENTIDVFDGNREWTHQVPNFGVSIGQLMDEPDARAQLLVFADMRIIQLYRPRDMFCYGLNLDWPDDSEWGYATPLN